MLVVVVETLPMSTVADGTAAAHAFGWRWQHLLLEQRRGGPDDEEPVRWRSSADRASADATGLANASAEGTAHTCISKAMSGSNRVSGISAVQKRRTAACWPARRRARTPASMSWGGRWGT